MPELVEAVQNLYFFDITDEQKVAVFELLRRGDHATEAVATDVLKVLERQDAEIKSEIKKEALSNFSIIAVVGSFETLVFAAIAYKGYQLSLSELSPLNFSASLSAALIVYGSCLAAYISVLALIFVTRKIDFPENFWSGVQLVGVVSFVVFVIGIHKSYENATDWKKCQGNVLSVDDAPFMSSLFGGSQIVSVFCSVNSQDYSFEVLTDVKAVPSVKIKKMSIQVPDTAQFKFKRRFRLVME